MFYPMKKTLCWLTIFIFLLTVFPNSNLQAQPQKKSDEGEVYRVQNYIAVMDLDLGKGADPAFRALLTNGLINELVRIGRYSIIDRANRNRILEEQGFQVQDCVEESCRVNAGRLLGVGKIVIGSITKVENTYFGMIQLINVETGKVESSAKEQCECSPKDLLELAGVLAGKLMGLQVSFTPKGPQAPAPQQGIITEPSQKIVGKGGLYIKTDPPGASISLNGQLVGDSPVTLTNLSVGNYLIEARKDNYYGQAEAKVIQDQFSNISVVMGLMKSRLTIITDPPEAQIFLDSNQVGQSPITLTDLAVPSLPIWMRHLPPWKLL